MSAALAVLGMGLVPPSPAYAYASDLGGGTVSHLTYRWSFQASSAATATSGTNDYLVYTPAGWTASDKLPLYVVLHGCPAIPGAGAEAMMDATRVNPIADSQRFVVLYPDNNASCWHAASPGREHTVRGGGGDADIVAGMTRAVMSGFNVDTERVYIIGFSAGADQASATGYAYPDLYAAVGADAGAGPSMDTSCIGMSDAMAPFYAESTVEQMGTRARAVPFFAIGGDGDPFGEADYAQYADPTGLHPKSSGCTRIAYLEALAIDGLLDPGTIYQTSYTQTGQITAAEDSTPEQGEPWTRQVALDGNGCEIAENWIVGNGHFWMGGSTDPAYAQYAINDVKAPSTGTNSWAFFRQFTLHGGNTACHPVTSATPAPAHGGAPSRYRASASARLVTADGVYMPGQLDASHVEIAPVSATVDSAAKGKDPRAVVDARNMTMNIPGAGVDQNPGVKAEQSAPAPDTAPVHQEGAAIPAAPVLNADVAIADAHARWDSNVSCITDGPIASGKSTLVNSQIEPNGDADSGENWQGSQVGMDDYISPSGSATSTSVIGLTRHDTDERYSLDATATTQVSGINVSDGTYVEIVSPAKAEVLATGVPGTARVAVSQPVLRVNGMTLASGHTFTTSVAGGPVIEIIPGKVATNVSTDGTTATASGTLAHIKVLDVTGTVTVADLTIGTLTATASVPAGGVSCLRSSTQTDGSTPAASAVAAPQLGATLAGGPEAASPRATPVRASLKASRLALAEGPKSFAVATLAAAFGAFAVLRRRRRAACKRET